MAVLYLSNLKLVNGISSNSPEVPTLLLYPSSFYGGSILALGRPKRRYDYNSAPLQVLNWSSYVSAGTELLVGD